MLRSLLLPPAAADWRLEAGDPALVQKRRRACLPCPNLCEEAALRPFVGWRTAGASSSCGASCVASHREI